MGKLPSRGPDDATGTSTLSLRHLTRRLLALIALALVHATVAVPVPAAAARPEGTLTVAVATFGNERWLPHLYVGAEDVVLKPMYENLLTRDLKTGELSPMLAAGGRQRP